MDGGASITQEELKYIHHVLSEHFKCFILVAADMSEVEVRMSSYSTDLQGVALQQFMEDTLEAYKIGDLLDIADIEDDRPDSLDADSDDT